MQINKPLYKDIKIGYPIGDDLFYEDFYLTSVFRQEPFKVNKITVAYSKQSEYITALQFSYASTTLANKVILGNIMGKHDAFNDQSNAKKEFILEENEYIIELKGRRGLIIDSFGITTSLGQSFSFGGSGGSEFSYVAPEGFHFSVFGGVFSPKWGNISSFSANIHRIPGIFDGKNEQNDNTLSKIDYQQYLLNPPVFRSLLAYLSLHDVSKIFLLSKSLSHIRYEQYVLGQLGLRCVFSSDPNLEQYLSEICKNYNGDKSLLTQIETYKRYCYNLVSNSSGEKKLEGFVFTNNRFVKSQFLNNLWFFEINSHGTFNLQWRCNLAEKLSKAEQLDLVEGRLALVAGAQLAESGYATEFTISLKIRYASETEEVTKKLNDMITRDFITCSVVYQTKKINTKEKPLEAILTISIWEKSFWPYKIRSVHFRKLPFETELETNLVKNLSIRQESKIVIQEQGNERPFM